MTETEKFTHPDFGTIRSVGGMIHLKDLLDILEITNTSQFVRKHLENDEWSLVHFPTEDGKRTKKTYAVTEAGFYVAVMVSQKPEAKKFRRWVTHEVLPALRRDGFIVQDSISAKNLKRLSEIVFYREVRQLFSGASDYVPSTPNSTMFFAKVQNQLHKTITGLTSQQLKSSRGALTPKKSGKDLLTEEELTQLKALDGLIFSILTATLKRDEYSFEDIQRGVDQGIVMYKSLRL